MNDDMNSKLRTLVDKWRYTADYDAGDGWNVAHGACANELATMLDAEQPRDGAVGQK